MDKRGTASRRRFAPCQYLLLAGCVLVFLPACPSKKADHTPMESAPRSLPVVVSRCGPGLAAEDLAGRCRVRDCPTPGALEAEPPPDGVVSCPDDRKRNRPATDRPKAPAK